MNADGMVAPLDMGDAPVPQEPAGTPGCHIVALPSAERNNVTCLRKVPPRVNTKHPNFEQQPCSRG